MPAEEQAWWLARYDRAKAEHDCGHPHEACSDPERAWYPQLSICYVKREASAAQAKFDRLHRDLPYHDGTMTAWAKEPSAAHPYHYGDGATVWVASKDHGLGGDFLGSGDPHVGE